MSNWFNRRSHRPARNQGRRKNKHLPDMRRARLRIVTCEQLELRAMLTSFLVTNTSNDAAVSGSLPFEVAAAKADTTGTDVTINFDEAAGHTFATAQTIDLTGTLDLRTSLQNTIAGKSMTINGPAAGLTLVGGRDQLAVFSVFKVEIGTTVTLNNLTVTKGNAAAGGGIENLGTLTVNNSTFTDNAEVGGAAGGLSNGGAIDNRGVLTVSGSTFSGNTSVDNGGAIFNANTKPGTVSLTVTDSTFSGNSSTSADGGAIYNNNGAAITHSTFSGNSSSADGGAIYNNDTVVIHTSAFSSNQAGTSGTGNGGGIYNNSSLTVYDSTFSANTAKSWGGGLYNNSAANIHSSSFTGNAANGGNGGGAYNDSALTLVNSTVANNTSSGDGGGIANDSQLDVIQSTIAGNSGVHGAGIFNSSEIEMSGSTVSGNTAGAGGDGGGVFNSSGYDIWNTIIAGNTAPTVPDFDAGGKAPLKGASHDLIGSAGGLTGSGISDGDANGNLVGHAPLLAPLGDYGGGTQTMAELPGSPTINASGPFATLFADVTASATSLPIKPFSLLSLSANESSEVFFDIFVGSEEMAVTGTVGGSLEVTRGVNGTAAAAHSTNDPIILATDQRGIERTELNDMGAFQTQGFTVTANAGDSPQSTATNTAFANPLGVTVTSADPKVPVDGGVINYTVNAGGSGQAAMLSSETATISGGKASVNATANGTAGSYTVTAAAGPFMTADFNLANTGTSVQPGSLQFSAATYNANETDPSATITINRTGGSDGAVSVVVATADGTAKAGTDYTATTQTVNWAAGDSTPKTITIPLLDDNATGESAQTVNLSMSNVTGGATIGSQNTATLSIAEDSDTAAQPGTLAFSAATYSANETDPSATITINRTGGSDGAVSVTVSTSDGTAKAGSDYTATTQTVSWAAGDSTPKTVSIPLIDDNALGESTATVKLSLASAMGGAAVGSQNTATLSIAEDNDTPPALGNALYLQGQAGDGSDATFVHNLYRNLLGRESEAAGQAFWVGYLEHNGSQATSDPARRNQVVEGFMNTPEYKDRLVIGLYQNLLHRAPDPAGLQFWLDKLGQPGSAGGAAGSSDEKYVVAAIAGSQEYYVLHGSSAQSWVDALYVDLLGRPADGDGQSFWNQESSRRGDDRDGIVRDLLSTTEANHRLLNAMYPNAATIPSAGSPASGPFALANITGDGWEDLYFRGPFAGGSSANDVFFSELQAQTPWDTVIEQMVQEAEYYRAS